MTIAALTVISLLILWYMGRTFTQWGSFAVGCGFVVALWIATYSFT